MPWLIGGGASIDAPLPLAAASHLLPPADSSGSSDYLPPALSNLTVLEYSTSASDEHNSSASDGSGDAAKLAEEFEIVKDSNDGLHFSLSGLERWAS